jgi:hypothetical protein
MGGATPQLTISATDDNPYLFITRHPLSVRDVVQEVLEFLPVHDLMVCRLVNSDWNAAAANAVVYFNRQHDGGFSDFVQPSPMLKWMRASIELRPPSEEAIRLGTPALLRRRKTLRTVVTLLSTSLRDVTLTDVGDELVLQCLRRLAPLRSVALQHTGQTHNVISVLYERHRMTLESVRFSSCASVEATDVTAFADFPLLHTLDLPPLRNVIVPWVRAFVQLFSAQCCLQHLTLTEAHWLDDDRLLSITGLRSLVSLGIDGREATTHGGLCELAHMPQLASLQLSHNYLNLSKLSALGQLTNISSLTLDAVSIGSEERFLRTLESMTGLRLLSLLQVQLNRDTIAELKRRPIRLIIV